VPADVLLADGTTVHIRPIRPDDADALVALHSRFSERTRYLRFFSPYPRIPPRDLERFVNVDHGDREALVVVAGESMIALGQYERLGAGSADAEVAFAVEDAHQGRGVGSVLLEHLAAAAPRVGISRFVAEVLPQNAQMLRVFAEAGFQVTRAYADGVVHLTFPIAPTARSLEVQWAREHRTEAASIGRLLTPRSVAVYGVRRDGTGVGAAVLRHVVEAGFTGPVYAIHPDGVAGVRGAARDVAAYASATAAPGPVDLAVIAVPAPAVPAALADAAAGGAHGVVVLTAGFAEVDPVAGAARQRALVTAARGHGLRLVGPNTLGVANTDPAVRLNASLAPALPERGRVGLFSQSGALGVALLAEAHARGLGLSTFVSAGNRADVSGNDLLQYWREDPATDVVALYLETFGNPRKFSRIARVLGREKPIVVVPSGTRPRGMGVDPTAVGPDPQAVTALVARSGVIRVETVSEMFDVATMLSRAPLPAGGRVAVVSNAAALGALAAGVCARAGLEVPVPAYPASVAPTSSAGELAATVGAAVADRGVDAVVVVVSPPVPGLGVDPADHAGAVAAAGAGADKPVIAAFVGSTVPAAAGVLAYPTVEEAVRALARVVRYASWRREPVGVVPQLSTVDPDTARAVAAAGGPVEGLLSAYGIEVLRSRAAPDAEGALAAADELGYPAAVKSAAPGLRHRLDLGAVRLDIAGPDQLRRVYAEVSAAFGPDVLVQPMAPPGVACVVEAVDDPSFGPVVGFGLGGVATELLGDRAWRAAPLTDVDAAALVRAPLAAPMLTGYRGAAPVDLDALAEVLVRVGRLADEQPAVKWLELNPVLAHPSGLTVLHAAVRYGPPDPRPDTGPRHL
jgi:acyl-CoA synthetase (NDP forming)/GNAT superfamily N-acetyltransferase